MFYDPERNGYRARALNGHTFPVGKSANPTPLSKPALFLRGTALESASGILQSDLLARKRRAIHMADYRFTRRQIRYLFHHERKQARLAIGGPSAQQDGIAFTRLGNHVVVSDGMRGAIPRCMIAASRLPNKNGSTRFGIDALRGNAHA